MLAFHNDPTLKTFVLDQLALHRAADQLVKGRYWDGGKGCAVGCTLEAVRKRSGSASMHHENHALYESELGIPQVLAQLEDRIFECLSNRASQMWPERFTNAIRPGADLSGVWPKFAVWLLVDPQDGVIQFAKTNSSRKSIQDVADAYARGETDSAVWRALRAYAAAAEAAAYAAGAADTTYAYAAAYAAAYATAEATTYAYAATAEATTYAYAATAEAKENHYEKMSDKLIELLEAA